MWSISFVSLYRILGVLRKSLIGNEIISGYPWSSRSFIVTFCDAMYVEAYLQDGYHLKESF